MRVDNWQTELSNFLTEVMVKPFDFIHWNCAFFAAGAIKAQTKVDILKEIRNKFKNETGAAKQLQSIYGVKNVQQLFRQKLNTPLKSVAFARPGDIVFATGDRLPFDVPTDTKLFGPVPGVCYGQQSYMLGENGLIKVETLNLGSTLWVS